MGQFLINKQIRSEIITGLIFGNRYHQRSTFTIQNRYPFLFKACADYLSGVQNPRILSFGCSTGDEVYSIGEYIPHAEIVGVDINLWCIRQCNKKNKNPSYSFVHRFSKKFENAGDFDAIFCMAVFQRTENRTSNNNSTSQGYTFKQFEQEIVLIDAKLKQGGLMIIDQADFSFTDVVCSENYIPLNSFERNQMVRNRPLFDRNNLKIAESQNNYRVFVKL